MEFIINKKNFHRLKEYGFKLPEEWLTSGALEGTNVNEYCMMDGCYYIYLMDGENPFKIAVEDSGNPLLEGWVDTRPGEYGILWFDAIPYCTYHVGMDDLEMMMDIIYRMTKEGILERIDIKLKLI